MFTVGFRELKTFFFGLFLLHAPLSLAGHGKEGGDLFILHKRKVIGILQGLKGATLRNYVSSLSLTYTRGNPPPSYFTLMAQKSLLLKDLKEAPYEFETDPTNQAPLKCFDKDGTRVSAHTESFSSPTDAAPELRAICFDVEKIAQESAGANVGELQNRIRALALHEHAHHFDIHDTNHSLMEYFSTHIGGALAELSKNELVYLQAQDNTPIKLRIWYSSGSCQCACRNPKELPSGPVVRGRSLLWDQSGRNPQLISREFLIDHLNNPPVEFQISPSTNELDLRILTLELYILNFPGPNNPNRRVYIDIYQGDRIVRRFEERNPAGSVRLFHLKFLLKYD